MYLLLVLIGVLLVACASGGKESSFSFKPEDLGKAGGWLSFIFKDLSEKVLQGDASGIIGARILFLILIFSVLFGVSQIVLGTWQKNIRMAIALILALVSSLAIPGGLLITASQVWGGAVWLAMVLVPVIAGFYALYEWKVLQGETRGVYFTKLIIASVILFISTYLAGGVAGFVGAAETVVSGLWEGFDTIFTLLSFFSLILVGYYIFKIISPGEKVEGDAETGIKRAKQAWRALKREYRFDTGQLKIADKLEKAIQNKDQGGALKFIKKLNGIVQEEQKLDAYINSVLDKAPKGRLSTNLETLSKELIKQLGQIIPTLLDGMESQVSGGDWVGATNSISPLKKELRKLQSNILGMEALVEKLQ